MSKELVKTKQYGPISMGGYDKAYRPKPEPSNPDKKEMPKIDETAMEQAKEISRSRGMGEGAARYQYKRLQLQQTMAEAKTAGSNGRAGQKMLNKHYENLARVFNVDTFRSMYGLQDNGDDEMKPKFEKRLPHKMKKGDIVCTNDNVMGVLEDAQIMGPNTRMVFQDRSVMADSFSHEFSVMLDAYPSPEDHNNTVYNKKNTLVHTLKTKPGEDSVMNFHHGLQSAFKGAGIGLKEGDHVGVTMPGTQAQAHFQVQQGKLHQFEPDNRNSKKTVTHGDYNTTNMQKFNSTGSTQFKVNDKNNSLYGATIHHLRDEDHYNNVIKRYKNQRISGKGPSTTMAEDFKNEYNKHVANLSDKKISLENKAISESHIKAYNQFNSFMKQNGNSDEGDLLRHKKNKFNPDSAAKNISEKKAVIGKDGTIESTGHNANVLSMGKGNRPNETKPMATSNSQYNNLKNSFRNSEKIDSRGQDKYEAGLDVNKHWNTVKNGTINIHLPNEKGEIGKGKIFSNPAKNFYKTHTEAKEYAQKHGLDFSKHVAMFHGDTTKTSSTVSEEQYQQALKDKRKGAYNEHKQAWIETGKRGAQLPGSHPLFRKTGNATQKTIMVNGVQTNIGNPGSKSSITSTTERFNRSDKPNQQQGSRTTTDYSKGSTRGAFIAMHAGGIDSYEKANVGNHDMHGLTKTEQKSKFSNKEVNYQFNRSNKKGTKASGNMAKGMEGNGDSNEVPGVIPKSKSSEKLKDKFSGTKTEKIKHATEKTGISKQVTKKSMEQNMKDIVDSYKGFKEKTK